MQQKKKKKKDQGDVEQTNFSFYLGLKKKYFPRVSLTFEIPFFKAGFWRKSTLPDVGGGDESDCDPFSFHRVKNISIRNF